MQMNRDMLSKGKDSFDHYSVVNYYSPDCCCGTFAELTTAVAFRTGVAIDWTPLVVEVFEALLGTELFASLGNSTLLSSICFFFSKSPW